MEWFAANLNKPITLDQMATLTGATKSSISKNISILTNNGWVITKTSVHTFVCHAVGTINPDVSLTKRQPQFRRVQRSKRKVVPTPTQIQDAVDKLAKPPVVEVVPQVVPEPVAITPVVVEQVDGVKVGDYLEVVFVSRHGLILAQHEDGETGHVYKLVSL